MINTSVERITPVQAERYLEKNTNNRNMRQHHVDRLALDIVNGRWHINGASIVFNGDGTLIDGQHRLSAIIKAGVPVDMVVVRGVSKAAMPTIDANISRKPSDAAKLRGYTNTNHLVSTVRLLISAKTGTGRNGERLTTGAIMDVLMMHPHLQDSVSVASKLNGLVSTSIVACWHYLTFYVGSMTDEATLAMQVMEKGIPHYPDDAIHVFRERCIKDKSPITGNIHKRLTGLWTLSLAWNDFCKKTPRTLCRIQQTEVKIDGVDYSKI